MHGCVEFDGEDSIAGVLLDGNKFEVGFVGQPNDLQIVYNDTVCMNDVPDEAGDPSDGPSNGAALYNPFMIMMTWATVALW